MSSSLSFPGPPAFLSGELLNHPHEIVIRGHGHGYKLGAETSAPVFELGAFDRKVESGSRFFNEGKI